MSLNDDMQPVVRVSRKRALEFCELLSERTGMRVTLPTEEQWEYACRAGTDVSFWYGDENTDFSPYANMADRTIKHLAFDTDGRRTVDITPRDDRFNDGRLVTADVGAFKPNAWGLFDMAGNVQEWTETMVPRTSVATDEESDADDSEASYVVRGGGFKDTDPWFAQPRLWRPEYRSRQAPDLGFRCVKSLK